MYRELWGAEFGLLISNSEAKVPIKSLLIWFNPLPFATGQEFLFLLLRIRR